MYCNSLFLVLMVFIVITCVVWMWLGFVFEMITLDFCFVCLWVRVVFVVFGHVVLCWGAFGFLWV